jgi:hypothetical protein
MSQADNLRDLQRHAEDFAERRGFTYTVLSTGTAGVIGCVYIYPPRGDGPGGTEAGRHAVVRSWVRADRATLDPVLYHVVLTWLERGWPFLSIEYAHGHDPLSIPGTAMRQNFRLWTVGIAQAPNGGSVRASFVAPPTIKVLPSAQSGKSGYLCTTAGTRNIRTCRRWVASAAAFGAQIAECLRGWKPS